MRVIVDANIVFSGILKSSGNIGNLLINSKHIFSFIAPNFLRKEIRSHYPKLIDVSKLPFEQVLEEEYRICKFISFISEEQILPENWEFAYHLVNDIDPKDIVYVAYAKQFECILWTGDKRLKNGLSAKGFENMIQTDELMALKRQIESEKIISQWKK
jgi:predicted nucleic acid-binding protein